MPYHITNIRSGLYSSMAQIRFGGLLNDNALTTVLLQQCFYQWHCKHIHVPYHQLCWISVQHVQYIHGPRVPSPPLSVVNGHPLSLARVARTASYMMPVWQFLCSSNLCCATVLCCYNVRIRKWWRNLSFASSAATSANIGCEVTSLVGLKCVKGLHILCIWHQIEISASDLLKTITLTWQVQSTSLSPKLAV